jgi:iron complex outermembrane receptor protein
MWQLHDGYAIVSSLSSSQRAPATEELYSHGPHESTLSYDIGDQNLQIESSKNLELGLQKSTGMLRWKLNFFLNKVANYVYGKNVGQKVNEEGESDPAGQFTKRLWTQAPARIRGGEAEISYNQMGEGYSVRGFADTSHATLDDLGNLPLQPATRVGFDVGYREAGWRHTLSVLHALRQDRLASFETFETPAFTKVDLNFTYTRPFMNAQLTWFAQVKNLLNQDIRLATSVLKETVPQPKRGLIAGVRMVF